MDLLPSDTLSLIIADCAPCDKHALRCTRELKQLVDADLQSHHGESVEWYLSHLLIRRVTVSGGVPSRVITQYLSKRPCPSEEARYRCACCGCPTQQILDPAHTCPMDPAFQRAPSPRTMVFSVALGPLCVAAVALFIARRPDVAASALTLCALRRPGARA